MRSYEEILEDGQYICRKCHGHKIVRAESHGLQEVCPHCQGVGTEDWIDHAMGSGRKASDYADTKQLRYNVAMRNIEHLMQEIKRQGMMIDVDIDVRIEKRPREDFTMKYLLEPMPPLVIPKNSDLEFPFPKDFK